VELRHQVKVTQAVAAMDLLQQPIQIQVLVVVVVVAGALVAAALVAAQLQALVIVVVADDYIRIPILHTLEEEAVAALDLRVNQQAHHRAVVAAPAAAAAELLIHSPFQLWLEQQIPVQAVAVATATIHLALAVDQELL
jgi:hypothetical protein